MDTPQLQSNIAVSISLSFYNRHCTTLSKGSTMSDKVRRFVRDAEHL